MRRRLPVLLLVLVCLAGAAGWLLSREDAERAQPAEVAAPTAPRPVPVPPGPARLEADPPRVTLETPALEDAGEEPTVLVIRVPGAMPGEQARAAQRSPGRSETQSCVLVDETCTLNPRVGTWLLSVLQRGATPAERAFEVVPGRNEVTLSRAKTNTVVVRVVDSVGAPVARATVSTAQGLDAAEHRLLQRNTIEVSTDARGECLLPLVLDHSEPIQARADGYLDSERVTVRSSDATIVLTLARVPSVRGRVVRSDRQIVSRFSIDGRDFEASDGRFAVQLAVSARTSQQHFTFRGPGLVPTTRVVSAAAGDVELGDVVLETARDIRGRVLDRLTGQPVAGAKVVGASNAKATSDALGQFVLESQPLRAVQLVGHARGHVAASVEAGPDQNELVLRLGPGVSVSGVYTGPFTMNAWVVAVGPTVELARLDEARRFTFDSLSPGTWTFIATIHHLDDSVLEGLPVERQSEFVQAIVGMERRGTRLELGTGPITELELQ